MTVYTAGYDDDLNLHDAPLINSSLNLVLTEKGYVGTAFYPGYGLTLTQNLLLTLASSYTWTAGGLISETEFVEIWRVKFMGVNCCSTVRSWKGSRG